MGHYSNRYIIAVCVSQVYCGIHDLNWYIISKVHELYTESGFTLLAGIATYIAAYIYMCHSDSVKANVDTYIVVHPFYSFTLHTEFLNLVFGGYVVTHFIVPHFLDSQIRSVIL